MIKHLFTYQSKQLPFLLAAVFIILYSLLAFVNHYCFRTYALDLGAYTNALYDYAHFRFNDCAVFKEEPQNLLSDHLDFYLPAFSPLSIAFGQYTLQIIQILSIVSGAFGCYKYLDCKFGDKRLSIWGMLHFFLFFGAYSALSFDYHSNVVASMQMPWLFYFAEKRKRLQFFLCMCLIMLAKETMPLWCFFICAGLFVQYRPEKKLTWLMAGCAVFALTYFLLCVQVFMPMLANTGKYEHFKYAILGTDYPSALKFVLTHPLETIRYMFSNHTGKEMFDGVKGESYMFLGVSGMFLLIARPAFILMLLGPLMSKMLYNDPTVWSIDCHYSAEFAAIITIGAFTIAGDSRSLRLRRLLPVLLCICSAAVTFRLMDNTVFYHDYDRLRIYQSGHYGRNFDIKKIYEEIHKIPATEAVSAQSAILPHLAYRDRCYQFPMVKDARFIIVSKSDPVTYPLNTQDFFKVLGDTMSSGNWKVLTNDTNVTVLERRVVK